MHNLIEEGVVRIVALDGGRSAVSLPELFSKLAEDKVADFPGLRPHQAPAWHAFLVQLAALACDAADIDHTPCDDVDAWRRLLRGLTSDWPDDAPWRLVGPSEIPAFLQPPVPDGCLGAYKSDVLTPDALDVLVTSKNHDLKAARMIHAEPDEWLFALVTLQTQEGFLGAGNYGIARMNGGFGSRPYMGLSPVAQGLGAAVMRDVHVLLNTREETLNELEDRFGFCQSQRRPVGLVWLEPWDGTNSLAIGDLHPWFIEACRRVRLDVEHDQLVAKTAGSKSARIDAKERLGVLGDPWAPVEVAEPPKVLTLNSDGFGYRKVVELMFGGERRSYQRPILAIPTPEERGRAMRLWLAALARGQGKTEGFHRREFDLPAHAVNLFAKAEAGEDETLRRRARIQVQTAGLVARSALRPALIVLVQKGPAEASWSKPSNDSLVGPGLAMFDDQVDDAFFGSLWEGLAKSEDEARREWSLRVAKVARSALDRAADTAPRADQRRIIAQARARNLFEAGLNKHLPDLRGTPTMELDLEPLDAAHD